MTTETQQRLERLARWACRTCRGSGSIVVSSTPTMPEHGTLEQECCPECSGTGLAAPELTERCEYPACREPYGPHPNHEDCNGTGRILKPGPALLVALLQALKAPHVAIDWYDWWHVRVVIAGATPTGYRDFTEEHTDLNEALLTAASKALAAALGVEE